jgi:hypothetical protein
MPARGERPPTFEIDAMAEAKDIRFHLPGRLHTHSEGVARVEHIRQRRGLPRKVREGTRCTDVSASLRIAAWLEDADAPGEPRRASTGRGRGADSDFFA